MRLRYPCASKATGSRRAHGLQVQVRAVDHGDGQRCENLLPLPPAVAITGLTPSLVTHMQLAVVGAHLSGMPLNSQLRERAATLVQATTTAAHYRLFALPNTTPPKPGLQRVTQDGAAIALEVWSIPLSAVGSFLALIPSPLGLGKVELADGSWVTSFICEGYALEGATDVTHHGGWRAYVASTPTT